jgi:hypothetical protein
MKQEEIDKKMLEAINYQYVFGKEENKKEAAAKNCALIANSLITITNVINNDFLKWLQTNYNMTLQIGVWRHIDTDTAHNLEQVIDCYKREQNL